MNDNEIKKYDDVFVYLDQTMSNWEKVITDDQVKIKTNQVSVHFTFVEKILQKFINEETNNKYTSALVGKWHLSGNNQSINPENFGLDYYAGILSGAVQDYYNWLLSNIIYQQLCQEVVNAPCWCELKHQSH